MVNVGHVPRGHTGYSLIGRLLRGSVAFRTLGLAIQLPCGSASRESGDPQHGAVWPELSRRRVCSAFAGKRAGRYNLSEV